MNFFLKILSDLPRSIKAVLLLFIDAIIFCFSVLLAFAVRFNPVSLEKQFWLNSEGVLISITMQLLALAISGLYRSVLRHAGAELLLLLLRSVLLGAGLFALLDLLFEGNRMPRSIIVMSTFFAYIGLLTIRLIIRWVIRLYLVEKHQGEKLKRVVIYGAGSAGLQLFESLRQEGDYQISAFVDDNPKLQGGYYVTYQFCHLLT